METNANTPCFFSWYDLGPFIVKIGFPAGMLIASILICWPPVKPAGIVLGALVGIVGLAHFLAIGLVKPGPEYLLYRRFFKWRRVDYEEIVKSGRTFLSFPPGLRYLKLRHFELPLGKLLYVPYTPVSGPVQRLRLSHQTAEYIRARIGKPAASLPKETI